MVVDLLFFTAGDSHRCGAAVDFGLVRCTVFSQRNCNYVFVRGGSPFSVFHRRLFSASIVLSFRLLLIPDACALLPGLLKPCPPWVQWARMSKDILIGSLPVCDCLPADQRIYRMPTFACLWKKEIADWNQTPCIARVPQFVCRSTCSAHYSRTTPYNRSTI